MKTTLNVVTTIDPSDGKTIEQIPRHTRAQIDGAVQTSANQFARWRSTSIDERAELFRTVAKTLRAQKEQLAAIAVREMGKPLVQARAEVEKCAVCADYFATDGAQMLADLPMKSDARKSYAAFRPLGIILAIMPWNFPFWQVFRAAVPALMAGNTMLLKHAENTTRCALEIERIFKEAGAPEGLFHTLVIGHDDATALIRDERVVAATLTGSERAGVAIGTAAGEQLKKTVLELGGSDAYIVLADADLPAAAKRAVTARFQNNGQSCIAAKRFIVEDRVHDEFVTQFVAAAGAQRIGNPMSEDTDLGPVARADLLKTLHEQVEDTRKSGGKVVLGGNQVDRAGSFYAPTIVDEVTPGMRMFDEETFGPAAAVIRARDARHAVELANASSYGLGCSIHTRDVEKA
ncbi:MAG: aldehyde dehydrogenase family protein, partial [Candidatus Eremiobacteraeota bacterium]|nr:aldehyde dehydrogenase family protein [Candidatus Eremiobacteraeota bacterium]